MSWTATATVVHALQSASAYASLASSTGSPWVRTSSERATLSTVELSWVLTESAWLSRGPGGSGRSKGNGQTERVLSELGMLEADVGRPGRFDAWRSRPEMDDA